MNQENKEFLKQYLLGKVEMLRHNIELDCYHSADLYIKDIENFLNILKETN